MKERNRVIRIRGTLAALVRQNEQKHTHNLIRFAGDSSTHRVWPNQLLIGYEGYQYVVTIIEARKPREPK